MKIIVFVFIIAIFVNGEAEAIRTEGECKFRVSSFELGTPQPVYLRDGEYLIPDSPQGISMKVGERLEIACVGLDRRLLFRNSPVSVTTGEVSCVSTDTVSGAPWLTTHTGLNNLHCNLSPEVIVEYSGTCYNNNTLLKVGYEILDRFHPIYSVCFDEENLRTLYVFVNQTAANVISQTVIPLPTWIGQEFFPDINITEVYNEQRHMFDHLVGVEQSDKYVTMDVMLTSGHVASLWHFIFEFSQRAAFSYLNSAPQWNTINEGNWDLLQQRLTVHYSGVGYNYSVYSGTYGTLQLRNANKELVDIYLYKDEEDNLRIPVPLYFYKIVYEEKEQLGTAFICVNNPHLRPDHFPAHTFCKDQCRNETRYDWLSFLDDNPRNGYCFCCDVNEFRETVDHLPHFEVLGMFTGAASSLGLFKPLAFLSLTVVLKYIFGLM